MGETNTGGLTAAARADVPTPTIVVTAHMWITWAELAIEHEREAKAARQAMLELHAKGGNFAPEMGRETAEGLLAVCSAAFAMDALVNVWMQLVIDQATLAKWMAPNGKKGKTGQVEQVLRKLCRDSKTAIDLKDRWKVVFAQRGGAVHFFEKPGPTVPHPSGITNAAEVHVTYGQENATAAVDLMMETLSAVVSASNPDLASWVAGMNQTVVALRAKRNN
jgi:hypothetical protein